MSPITNSRHEVQLWEHYGSVVTTLGTTNGHFAFIAELIAGWVRCGHYRVENSKLDPALNMENPYDLKQALSEAYRVWDWTEARGTGGTTCSSWDSPLASTWAA